MMLGLAGDIVFAAAFYSAARASVCGARLWYGTAAEVGDKAKGLFSEGVRDAASRLDARTGFRATREFLGLTALHELLVRQPATPSLNGVSQQTLRGFLWGNFKQSLWLGFKAFVAFNLASIVVGAPSPFLMRCLPKCGYLRIIAIIC